VQHYRYRTYIKKLLGKFGGLTTAKFPGHSVQTAAGHRAGLAKNAFNPRKSTRAQQPVNV
jgi:hypothetical protein